MKKIISIFLCAMLLSSQVVFAAENDKMAEILKLVKDRLLVSDSYDDFNSSSYEDEFSTVYSFSWGNTEKNESLNVSCTSDGIITSYYNYTPENNASKKPAFSDDLYLKAKNTAIDFVKKINPQIADKIVFEEKKQISNTYSHDFSFEFFVYENGYKVSTNNGYISLNQAADRITSFNLNYISKVQLKKPTSILTKDEAVLKYIEKLGLKLVYKMYRTDKETKVYPAFIEKESSEGKFINAENGEIYEPPANSAMPLYKTAMNTASAGAMAEEAAMDRASFSEIELKELDTVKGLISKEKAEEIIRSNSIINIPKAIKLNSINLSADYYDKDAYNYSLVFRNPDEKYDSTTRSLINLRATVDAKTGEIKSFNKYYINSEISENKAKISEEKAKQIAEKTLSAFGSKHIADFKLTDNNNPYYYTFTREVNGIPFIANTANVSIDQNSGEVLGWSVTDTDVTFPSLEKVLSASDAAKKLFEQVSYEPVYLVSSDKNQYVSALVYTMTDNYNISLNAETGKLINYKGEDIEKENSAVKYTDLDGHYAKEKIEKLASYGIAVQGKSEFAPDSAISQKELLAYILMAFEGEKNLPIETDEDINYIYRRALRLGLISNDVKSPDASVTRGDVAKMIINSLGFSEIAELKNIYNSPFKDANDLTGYLSLIYGLGIAKGDGSGYFYPERNITKAETAIMIYNYLSR